jgi:ferric-dicitrate binding protein FerR (iron transport regulator)
LIVLAISLSIVERVSRTRDTPRPAADVVLAALDRTQGRPVVVSHATRTGVPEPLSMATSIHADDVIVTDSQSRAGFRAADGSSVRIDSASRVRFLAPGVIEILSGAVYVSTAEAVRGFEVRTPLGIVRDTGTQFEVRVIDTSVRVRVRAGAIELYHANGGVTAGATGTETTVTPRRIVVRQIAGYGAEWAWTAELAPPFGIEGRPLRAFLEHVAEEQGWTVRYENGAIAEMAGRTILHGSVDGLPAEDAVRAVLATTGLQSRLRAGELLVWKPADAR